MKLCLSCILINLLSRIYCVLYIYIAIGGPLRNMDTVYSLYQPKLTIIATLIIVDLAFPHCFKVSLK